MSEEKEVYEVWKVSMWSDNLTEKIAVFYDLELAKEFVTYQISYHSYGCAVVKPKRISPHGTPEWAVRTEREVIFPLD